MVHDLLGMNVVVAQEVNVIILPGKRAMLGPVVLGRVHLQGFEPVRAIGDAGQRTLLLHSVYVAIPVDRPAIVQSIIHFRNSFIDSFI
jgi:hypothetical protein